MAGKQASSSYVETLPPDVRTRYNSKTACIKCDPYCIPSTEWGKDVSKWPLIGFLDVINYIVYSIVFCPPLFLHEMYTLLLCYCMKC